MSISDGVTNGRDVCDLFMEMDGKGSGVWMRMGRDRVGQSVERWDRLKIRLLISQMFQTTIIGIPKITCFWKSPLKSRLPQEYIHQFGPLCMLEGLHCHVMSCHVMERFEGA